MDGRTHNSFCERIKSPLLVHTDKDESVVKAPSPTPPPPPSMAYAARRVRRRNTLPAKLPSHLYETEICLIFLEGSCIQHRRKCSGAHYRLPYSWEVLEGNLWTVLDSSEKIEEDYCNPQKTYSTVDVRVVCFDTMTCGRQKVRRLSSISSVLQPTFLLTTEWLWYWKDEHGNWNQYDMPPNSSTELEQKFQNDPQEVMEFTAGSQTYTLSLQDMIQTNKRYGTKRMVRRRPRFLSSVEVQDIRTRAGLSGGGAGAGATCGGGATGQDKLEICQFFLAGNCIHPREKCFGAHYRLPYSWEVLEGHQWTLLDSSEEIEEDYCDPKITYSLDVEAVCFDTMTCGLQKVRRLSSISSVLQPTFLLTTEWLWYWEDEHGNWNQYDISPNSSTELEQKFQNDPQEVLEFTAGSQTYTLSLQDMIQTNKTYGTKRRVRRRPRFLSPGVVQVIRARNGLPNVEAFPRHWDKTQVPDIGYKKVLLQDSSEEYKEVETLFRQTMTTFDIVKIERIQNKTLWDKFQLYAGRKSRRMAEKRDSKQ